MIKVWAIMLQIHHFNMYNSCHKLHLKDTIYHSKELFIISKVFHSKEFMKASKYSSFKLFFSLRELVNLAMICVDIATFNHFAI